MSLPIEPFLDPIVAAAFGRGAVVVAAPGAGKSTRVPPALLAGSSGRVLVLQPRRLAARMLAARVAQERGSRLGEEVGYEVRHEHKSGPKSRIVFVTAGLFARKAIADPELRDIGCVVIDEFHERQIDVDLALALTRALRERRPELGLVVMSATFDPQPVAAFLGGAEVVSVPARAHPVEIRYAAGDPSFSIDKRVSAALRQLRGQAGNVLVFLPGKAEIDRSAETIAPFAAAEGWAIAKLHGALPPGEQDRAVRGPERRVVLSTNVAETSVTIDDVTAVIDSGLARVSRHDPFSGISRLALEPIARANADQRAGRAGRTRPGICVRLYEAGDFSARPAELVPEIHRADLTPVRLLLAGLDADELSWLDPPRPGPWEQSERLLERLGFVRDGAVTAAGRRALELPTHPRLARVIGAAIERGVGSSGCAAAAVIEVGPLAIGEQPPTSTSDIVDDVDHLVVSGGRRARHLDGRALAEAAKLFEQFRRATRARDDAGKSPEQRDGDLRFAIAAGFADRVCRRTRAGEPELAMAGAQRARLSPRSAVREAELMVAVDAARIGHAGGQRLEVRRASEIAIDDLIEIDEHAFADTDEVVVAADGAVERVQKLLFDGLVVSEDRTRDRSRIEPSARARALLGSLPPPAWRACSDAAEIDALRRRAVLAGHADALSDAIIESRMAEAAAGAASVAELRKLSLAPLLFHSLDAAVRGALERRAPATVSLPGRARVPVHYETDREPWIESRLQDFFGLSDLPEVLGEPVVAHLLAPNRRAVQITRDLNGFWDLHYPGLRKHLMRRYPRHAWPDDPRQRLPDGGRRR